MDKSIIIIIIHLFFFLPPLNHGVSSKPILACLKTDRRVLYGLLVQSITRPSDDNSALSLSPSFGLSCKLFALQLPYMT